MSSNGQKLSFKDKIVSHLPGHKNQDNNMNGVPDRMEKNTAATTGHRTLSDKNGNGVPDNLERQGSYGQNAPLTAPLGSSALPGTTQTITSTTTTSNRDGLPISGNILRDEVVTQQNITTEPALLPTQSLPLNQDLNRNGIPDQLEQGQGFGFIGSAPVNSTSVVDVREAPVIVEKIEKPAVVHEVLKTEEVIQVQPVIERERERLDVYEVVQPMREREVIATEVRSAKLPAQTRATVIEDQSAFLAQRSMPGEFSTREVAATMSQTVENAPIIHETIVQRVIEEVQPVIYKEIDRPILIKETLPIYEKIVEAPHAHHTVLPMRDLGVRTTGLTDLNRDGIPDQMQGFGYQTTGLQSGLQSQGSFSQDLNGNGIPDQLEGGRLSQGHMAPRTLSDLNGNGIPDRMEKAHGLKDLNGNGVDDSLERRMKSTNLNSQTF